MPLLALFLALSRLWAASDAPSARVATVPGELTVQDFFRPPAITAPKLNPSGTHIAWLSSDEKNDSTALSIYSFATHQVTRLRGTKVRDVYAFRWVGDDYIVYNVGQDNLFASGLFAIHIDHPENPKVYDRLDAVDMISAPASRPGHILLWVRRSARADGAAGPLVEVNLKRRYTAPFDEDLSQIERQIYPPANETVTAWLPDRAGEIRYAICETKGKQRYFRLDPSGNWKAAALDLALYRPLAVDFDPNFLLAARVTEEGGYELVRVNTVDGTAGPALYRDDKYDFSNGVAVFSHDGKTLAGLGYTKTAPTHVPLSDAEANLLHTVDQMLPENRVNLIVSRSQDGSRLLIYSTSDHHRGTLYFAEPAKPTLSRISDLAPWLPEKLLGSVQVTTFKARDGLRLDAYVTLPANYQPGKPAPMIVLPHGGPWVRDHWGYDSESQFFASRGYVVFQPNYRGSSGYNADISLKPMMDFRKMHEDVTDGVKVMIKSGIADPAHIAILGTSFGGYLAICGAAYEPGLYRCAVSIAGVFDWTRYMSEASKNDDSPVRRDWYLRWLGDPKAQQAKYESVSPVQAASQIKIPIFIAHGEEDPVVDASQSHRLSKTLAQAGVSVETMFASGEGHGFTTLKNEVELYQRIESFLKKNL